MTILYDLIDQDFGIRGNGRWYQSLKHDSLVYDAEKDQFFWNSRDIRGNALDYLVHVRHMGAKQARALLKSTYKPITYSDDREHPVYTPYVKLIDTFWLNGFDNRDYWYSRCITDETIDRRRLGYYEGWNLVPLELDGKFVNFQMRRDDPEKMIKLWYELPGWSPVLINTEILDIVDTIFITEGLVDAILLSQEGIPAVSHTGGGGYWNIEWCKYFSKIQKIYYIMDNDEIGRKAGQKVASNLGVYRTYLYSFEDRKKGYDTGDFFKEGGTAADFKKEVEENAKSIFEIGGVNEGRYKGKSYRISTASHRRY
jgi:hypothetical protein